MEPEERGTIMFPMKSFSPCVAGWNTQKRSVTAETKSHCNLRKQNGYTAVKSAIGIKHNLVDNIYFVHLI